MLHDLAIAPRPRLGVSIDVDTRAPGVVSLAAAEDHRVRIHAGAPVSGECGGHRFIYRHGDVDLVPAGVSDTWYEEDPARAIVLSLTPALLRRAAEEIGRSGDQVTLHPRHQFRDPRIEHVAWALEAEHAFGHENGVLYAESLGLALALHLLRSCGTAGPL